MLKITKGLIVDGIMTYTDDEGNEYVRVKVDGQDFCIAAHDYTKGERYVFPWKRVMKLTEEVLEQDGISLPTKEQISTYIKYLGEINSELWGIGGSSLKDDWYWTSTEDDSENACIYNGESGLFYSSIKIASFRVRLILNL
jgi:hypothetical protein